MANLDRSKIIQRDKLVSGIVYVCLFCKAEGGQKAFDTIQELAGHIRMAHKSSTKKRKKAKQIEKTVDSTSFEDYKKLREWVRNDIIPDSEKLVLCIN